MQPARAGWLYVEWQIGAKRMLKSRGSLQFSRAIAPAAQTVARIVVMVRRLQYRGVS
jgi:hypothetical protein